MPPKKNLSRGCLSNWCEDADAEISKTICRPPPYGGVDIISKSSPDLGLGPTMPNIELVQVIFIFYNVFKFHVPRLISFLSYHAKTHTETHTHTYGQTQRL